MSIYDDINFIDNPYNILRISENSDDITIKEAYKLLKSSTNPDKQELLEEAYNLIKTKEKRLRFSLLNNTPYDSIKTIKELGVVPRRLSKNRWIELIRNDNSKS